MIDVLKSNERLWDLFTKKEEYMPLCLDQYQRFPHYLSKHRNVLEPEVSAFLVQNGLEVKYPDGKKFAVCLTHDIDVVHPSILTIAYEAVKASQKRQIGKSLLILLSKIYKKFNPLRNFAQIMDLETKYGAKSTFYFFALDKNSLDFNFEIDELNEELRDIIGNGWEVGLHGGHEAYNNLNQVKKEKKRLENVIGKKVIGHRSHFLKFEMPTTWELLEEAGFAYDTTFGYADCVGFRNGMCHPFKPFNLNTNEYVDILEIPLTIMDTTFRSYMRLDMQKAWEITKRLIDTVEAYNGVMTILFHSWIADDKLELYQRVLRYCYERHAWMTSGEEIWRWWHTNNFLDQ